MSDIDPQEFGELRAEVKALRRDNEVQGRTLDRMAGQIDELMAMANKSQGGLWVAVTFGGVFGAVLTWFGERLLKG